MPQAPADPARRACLQQLALAGSGLLLSTTANAQTAAGTPLLSLNEMTGPIVGQARVSGNGIRLVLPALADNGHLVPLRVFVDSPMTEAEHVRQIVLLSQRNPVTRMATFHLGPWSGRAEIATRVRLAGTQVVVALAALSNGEFRLAQAEVVVTESACLDMG
jgi:sulfur-oxidizing protein SoxY